MTQYVIKRLAYMTVVLWLVSLVAFLVIELPPGDYLSTLIAQLEQQGDRLSEEQVMSLRRQYGLDLPFYAKYFKWIAGFLKGNFGYSFEWRQPVRELIGERLALTWAIAIATLLFTYAVAIPIGIYSATHQYSAGDYLATTVGFVGLATPNFMLALILLFVAFRYFGVNLGGLFSADYVNTPWSWGKAVDLLRHLPVPIIVVGTGGTAGLIRVLRASLLDELQKQYVITARAKGVRESVLLFKYPVRVAINPMVSQIATVFPNSISGGAITAVVLGLPTAGPMLLRALISQDTYLSASILMFITFLTVIGTSVADILLVLVDPRIRLEKAASHG